MDTILKFDKVLNSLIPKFHMSSVGASSLIIWWVFVSAWAHLWLASIYKLFVTTVGRHRSCISESGFLTAAQTVKLSDWIYQDTKCPETFGSFSEEQTTRDSQCHYQTLTWACHPKVMKLFSPVTDILCSSDTWRRHRRDLKKKKLQIQKSLSRFRIK